MEQSREAALAAFQDKIMVLVEKKRKTDGTIVGVTDVHSLTHDDQEAWETYKGFLLAFLKPNVDYKQVYNDVSVTVNDWRERASTSQKKNEVSRAAYYAWMLNRLSPIIMNTSSIIADGTKYLQEIIEDTKAEYSEYFGS